MNFTLGGKAMKNKLMVTIAILTMSLVAFPAMATVYTFGTSGTGLAASATFTQNGTDLEIVLKNTGAPATDNSQILSGLFWDSTTMGLTPVSATGHNLFTDTSTDTGSQYVGTGWQYKGISYLGNNQGVSATGLSDQNGQNGIFGPNGNFPPGPYTMLDGDNYGIVSGFATGTHVNQFPLVDDYVVFHLTLPSSDPISISQVTFQFGSAQNDFHTTVPLPPTALLLGSGLLGLGLIGWRRKKN
jgi:hypothetical protein